MVYHDSIEVKFDFCNHPKISVEYYSSLFTCLIKFRQCSEGLPLGIGAIIRTSVFFFVVVVVVVLPPPPHTHAPLPAPLPPPPPPPPTHTHHTHLFHIKWLALLAADISDSLNSGLKLQKNKSSKHHLLWL